MTIETTDPAPTLRRATVGRKPNPHLWLEGGGMVTRCSDPAVARPMLVEQYAEDIGLDVDDPDDVAELADIFPLDKARVERGRVVPAGPDHWDGYAWFWRRCREGATGRGVTTAVVWMETR